MLTRSICLYSINPPEIDKPCLVREVQQKINFTFKQSLLITFRKIMTQDTGNVSECKETVAGLQLDRQQICTHLKALGYTNKHEPIFLRAITCKKHPQGSKAHSFEMQVGNINLEAV